MATKNTYSTREVARICSVREQTIIRCLDAGRLEGLDDPASGARLIPRDSVIRFMQENDIPLDDLDSDRIRVLVVDDEQPLLDLFVDLLEREGFEVKTALTGYDGGLLTQQFRPDVLLLDYILPDINGDVVSRIIRSNPGLNDTRIILMAACDVSEAYLLSQGADAFFHKPFGLDQLVQCIRTLAKHE